jgi:hypothetical protein
MRLLLRLTPPQSLKLPRRAHKAGSIAVAARTSYHRHNE